MLILAVLERQPEHGYAIAQAIKSRSEGLLQAREGTLYPVLHSLEADGLIESTEREVGGRVRREYCLTEQGKKGLAQKQSAWTQQVRAVNAGLNHPILRGVQ